MKISIDSCPVCQSEYLQQYLTVQDYFLSQEEFNLLICPECELLLTSPQPTDVSKYYESSDYISHHSKKRNLITSLYNLVKDIQVKHKINLLNTYAKGKSLLDIGCGTGYFLQHAANSGYTITGVEINENARIQAQTLTGATIYQSIEDISSYQYNLITLWHVLEHLSDPVQQVKTIKSLLAENGTIIIAVPNYKSYDARHYQEYWAGYDVPRHLNHFSQKSITRIAKLTNLRVDKIIPMKFDSFYVSLLSEQYQQTGLVRYLKAITTGIQSNRSALKTTEYSSLIYVLQQQ